MNEFLQLLYSEGQSFSWLEIIAVITAIVYVVLATRGNKWCFFFGLISSIIYVYLTFILKFYFDFGINIYYIIMSFYGWVIWSSKTDDSAIQIHHLPKNYFGKVSIVGVGLTILFASTASRFSDADLPYLDAFTTIFSIIATYLVVKKYIENWLIWIVVDLVASGMYYYKELYLTSLLFLIYTIIAIFGFFRWKRLLSTQ